jgi:hypothetical protein
MGLVVVLHLVGTCCGASQLFTYLYVLLAAGGLYCTDLSSKGSCGSNYTDVTEVITALTDVPFPASELQYDELLTILCAVMTCINHAAYKKYQEKDSASQNA